MTPWHESLHQHVHAQTSTSSEAMALDGLPPTCPLLHPSPVPPPPYLCSEVVQALAAAQKEPKPPLSAMFTDVYAEMPWHREFALCGQTGDAALLQLAGRCAWLLAALLFPHLVVCKHARLAGCLLLGGACWVADIGRFAAEPLLKRYWSSCVQSSFVVEPSTTPVFLLPQSRSSMRRCWHM